MILNHYAYSTHDFIHSIASIRCVLSVLHQNAKLVFIQWNNTVLFGSHPQTPFYCI